MRRDLGNRASTVDRAHMKKPLETSALSFLQLYIKDTKRRQIGHAGQISYTSSYVTFCNMIRISFIFLSRKCVTVSPLLLKKIDLTKR